MLKVSMSEMNGCSSHSCVVLTYIMLVIPNPKAIERASKGGERKSVQKCLETLPAAKTYPEGLDERRVGVADVAEAVDGRDPEEGQKLSP